MVRQLQLWPVLLVLNTTIMHTPKYWQRMDSTRSLASWSFLLEATVAFHPALCTILIYFILFKIEGH